MCASCANQVEVILSHALSWAGTSVGVTPAALS